MTVISVPMRLRIVATTLFLCIPLIAAEVVMVSRSPQWGLPVHRVVYWSLAFTLICLPLVSWILAAKRLAYYVAFVLAIAWISASGWLAIRMGFPTLGFYTIALLLVVFLQFYGLRTELRRSYFDPQMKWYQGLPKAIPGLECILFGIKEQSLNLRVSRMDQDGAIVFCRGTEKLLVEGILEMIHHKKIQVQFGFRQFVIRCVVKPILVVQGETAVGIQFIEMNADSKKEVGDFVELLRGEGYV